MSWLATWFIFELIVMGTAPDLSEPQAQKRFLANNDQQSFTFRCIVFKKLHHIQVLTFDMNGQSGGESNSLLLLPASASTSLVKTIINHFT